MLKPSSKGRAAITKGIEEGVLVKNPNKYHPATPTRQPSARRKTSAEIASTVNGFVQEARASAKSATIKNERADPMKAKQKVALTNRSGISRNEMVQRLMQGQKLPVKPGNITNTSAFSKNPNASPTATISFGKNVVKVAEKPLSKSRTEQRTSPEVVLSTMMQANRKKSNASSVGTETRTTPSAVLGKVGDGKSSRRSSGSAVVRHDDQIGEKTQKPRTIKKAHMQAAPNYTPNYYLTSSSSEDEEFGGSSRDRGYEKPTSPASKAKMWNEIHKSPGPSFPGWKFRPPAHGRRLSQVGGEEFAETFKNLKIEADRASKKVQAEEPRQNKFSDYMRKIKSSSKSRDADTSTAGLEENINLKKMYSDQLDAMREKALASIKALDAETRGADADMSLEVVKDGVSRQYRGMSSTDMLKNAVDSLQQHRKQSFNLQKSEDGSYLDRKTGYEFAQGDRLYRNDTGRNKSAGVRNSNAASGPGGSAGERVRVTKDDQVRMMKKKEAYESREDQSQDALRMKAFMDNPLQKLKKISETLKMEKANALSRRVSSSLDLSSSESDYEPDGFRKEIKY